MIDFWKYVKHFEPWEFGIAGHGREMREEEARNMNPDLIIRLDGLREYCKRAVIIHAGFAVSGHQPNSQHYLGNAADFHIEGLSLIDQYLLAERFNFHGIGLYPDWNHPGLHCDMRPRGTREAGTRWVRFGEGEYLSLSEEVLLSLKGVRSG